MSGVESGSPVSNGSSSPLSPDPLLDSTPLTLDFDPMSFQFKEFSSPTEEEPPSSPIEQERRTPTLTLFDPFATISPDESDIAFEPIVTGKESHFDPLSNVTPEEPDILMDPFGITMSEPFIPEHFQNGVEITEPVSKNVLSCVVHETLEPDILVNPSMCNTNNPDLVLIDTQEPQDTVTNDVSTSDLVASATVTTNIDDLPRVLECAVITLTETCAESVFVQDGDSHADDFPVVNVLEHGSEVVLEKDVNLDEDVSESDSDVNSHSHKVLTLKKKASSVSSESSLSENESSGKTTKQTVIRQSTVEKSIIVTSKEETQKESSMLQMNGMESKNSKQCPTLTTWPHGSPKEYLQNGQYDHESSSSSDEEERKPIECPISIQKLDDHIVVVGGDGLNETSELPKEEIVAVDLKSLDKLSKKAPLPPKQDILKDRANKAPKPSPPVAKRTQYVQQIGQEPPPSPYKEVISTGIDLQVLKTSYSQIAAEDTSLSSKETISTGVDIRTLKKSLSHVGDEPVKGKEAETIETGISVNTLKTSFNKSQEEIENFASAPVEEVKPSVDRAQVTRKFSQDAYPLYASLDEHEARGSEDVKLLCRICNKHVYQMEKVTAEKSVFHKDCFKCKECGKKLTVDTYSSHEKEIYCKLHFKQLFQPKCQFGGEDTAPTDKSDDLDFDEGKQRRNEMVISENTPVELPPDVVRCETKSNDLESLSSLNLLNIKSRFESHHEETHQLNTSDLCTLQRSPSLMARMAKYQSAVSGDHTNGDLSGGEDEADRDSSIVRESKPHEKVVFSGMSNLKSQWESGQVLNHEENDELKDQRAKLRQRMCLGRSESMRAVYEKACQEAKQPLVHSETVALGREVKALSIKEKFEKGSVERDADIEAEKQERIRREKEDDLSCLVEPGTAEGARSLFKQMDAVASSGGTRSPGMLLSPMKSSSTVFQQQGPVVVADVVKCSNPVDKDEIQVETTQISEKFRFFEKYQEPQKERKRFQITPPREPVKEGTPETEVARDPNIIRCVDAPEDDLPATDTAKKMLNKFKALESQAENPVPVPVSMKPLKRITPPREQDHRAPSPEPARQPDPDIVRCSYKAEEDTSLVEVDKAKSLRAKFENWTSEVVRENLKSCTGLPQTYEVRDAQENLKEQILVRNEKQLEVGSGGEEEYMPQADMTKTLRAMFESIKETDPLKAAAEKPKPKVSRFIEQQQKMAGTDICASCDKKIYPVEKLEISGMKLHKHCFKCAHCNSALRFENYTTSGGKLFCVTHFKQLFISKGNYDEGFGREQHKEKWNRSRSNTPTPREECSSNASSFTEKTSEVAI